MRRDDVDATVRRRAGVCNGGRLEDSSRDERALVAGVLRRDEAAIRQFVRRYTPIIQSAVASTVLSFGRSSTLRNVREEVRDLTQDVFVVLFDQDDRVLTRWDPERGMKLGSFLSLVARRRTLARLRRRSSNPWTQDPVETERVESALVTRPETDRVEARQLLESALETVQLGQSERGREMVDLLLVQDLDTEEVEQRTGLSRAAVYKWRSRLVQSMRTAIRGLTGDGG
jgi:RNA polymerase sigma-70 factor (ECF subfamily)